MDKIQIELTEEQRDEFAYQVRVGIRDKLGSAASDYYLADEEGWEKLKADIDGAFELLRAMGAKSDQEIYQAERINRNLILTLGPGVAEWRDNALHMLKADTSQLVKEVAARIAAKEDDDDIPF